ncbi:GNAT family N-acetyltransferase [Clostridium sp. 'White wine YQ']|uniref:GNAT family N-acetyltransferase n=1 Tax=Clostridium sp. 'White wine YQ' TaxID=3027474 RepID=UPI002365BB79|nr:GNAT family N-acetyltransferase [Clostridium sp. 'White wine YQ']MDD7793397.1 GNAT family N-acetyltransferase [Clostridium sp. 'White wine YQ']
MNYELKELNENTLDTERLYLFPLEAKYLELAIKDYKRMQLNLRLNVARQELIKILKYAMEIRLKRILEDPNNYLWLTCWAIIHKEDNKIIGFVIVKGVPNDAGEVIVGYGIDEEEYRMNRYATEAVSGLVNWMFKDPKVNAIIADTDKGNIASHRVLRNLGASIYKEDDELIWWRIEKLK